MSTRTRHTSVRPHAAVVRQEAPCGTHFHPGMFAWLAVCLNFGRVRRCCVAACTPSLTFQLSCPQLADDDAAARGFATGSWRSGAAAAADMDGARRGPQHLAQALGWRSTCGRSPQEKTRPCWGLCGEFSALCAGSASAQRRALATALRPVLSLDSTLLAEFFPPREPRHMSLRTCADKPLCCSLRVQELGHLEAVAARHRARARRRVVRILRRRRCTPAWGRCSCSCAPPSSLPTPAGCPRTPPCRRPEAKPSL